MVINLSQKNIADIKKLFKIPKRITEFHHTFIDYIGKTKFDDVHFLEKFILKNKIINSFSIRPSFGVPIKLYATKSKIQYTPYEIAKALYPQGYFCNFTSIYYHGLTNQIPIKIYVAIEGARQKDKHENIKNISLTDFNIKTAFLKPHRVSEKIFDFQKNEIQLNEKVYRKKTGVEHLNPNILGIDYEITCIERALIDAVVSPQYNGGIANVIDYYRNASTKINFNKFLEIYKELDFIYPYWQTIGFISEKTKLKQLAEKLYTNFNIKNKFYLDHEAKSSWKFDEKWQIFYPESLFI